MCGCGCCARSTGSVLWLSETNQTAARNLGRQAQGLRVGIDPARLIFASRLPLNED